MCGACAPSRATADLRPTHSRQGFDDAALADRRFAAARQALQLRFEPLQIGDALAHFDQMRLHQAIDIDVPIGCGDAPVFPGDVVVGDNDGVIIIPAHLAEEIAADWGYPVVIRPAFTMGGTGGGIVDSRSATTRPIQQPASYSKPRMESVMRLSRVL